MGWKCFATQYSNLCHNLLVNIQCYLVTNSCYYMYVDVKKMYIDSTTAAVMYCAVLARLVFLSLGNKTVN